MSPPDPVAAINKIMTTTDELRELLGPVGIWMPPPAAIGLDPGEFARTVEDTGFSSVWIPGVNAAEKIWSGQSGQGAIKKAWVIQAVQSYFNTKGVKLDVAFIDSAIEAAVQELFASPPADSQTVGEIPPATTTTTTTTTTAVDPASAGVQVVGVTAEQPSAS